MTKTLEGSVLTFLIAGLVVWMRSKRALEVSVSFDLSSRDPLLKSSLLQLIYGLKTGGLNSTIRKQGSMDVSTISDIHKDKRRHTK